jgi:hypothetical protein
LEFHRLVSIVRLRRMGSPQGRPPGDEETPNALSLLGR